MPLSDTSDLFDLQAGEPFETPTNSDVFNVPQGATAVLDEFNDHPLSLSCCHSGAAHQDRIAMLQVPPQRRHTRPVMGLCLDLHLSHSE
jgi:hypothetical protein